MKPRRSRSPVFRCKDQFGGRVLDSAIPWPPDSNLVPQITTRIRRQSQKLRINPEIVQQESHLFSMSPSPTNYGLPTRIFASALRLNWRISRPRACERREDPSRDW